MHPTLCRYTSEVFYEGRLAPHPGRERLAVSGGDSLSGVGLRFISVPHEGRRSESLEEAEEVARLVHELLTPGAQWIDEDAKTHDLGLGEILVISPYNAQVKAIANVLPGARIGTVDKFQWQEAPIVIYLMASSSAEEAPRGMEFLYNLHRLNVATSRARCVAAIVASPRVALVRCRTPRQMRLANALARFLELDALAAESVGG